MPMHAIEPWQCACSITSTTIYGAASCCRTRGTRISARHALKTWLAVFLGPSSLSSRLMTSWTQAPPSSCCLRGMYSLKNLLKSLLRAVSRSPRAAASLRGPLSQMSGPVAPNSHRFQI